MFERPSSAVNLSGFARSTIAQLASAWRRGLLPPCCLLCAGPGAADGLDLCAPCRRTLLPATPTTLAPFARVYCPWRYAWPLDRAIQALKFQGERAWGGVFGAALAEARRGCTRALPALLVPVPLHLARQRTRGFNQSADIARCAARALGLPWAPHVLERLRATEAQSALSAATRAANVAGAFGATHPLAGQRIALIDDVLTTGSTAVAAALALRAAGAGELELWVVARAEGGRA